MTEHTPTGDADQQPARQHTPQPTTIKGTDMSASTLERIIATGNRIYMNPDEPIASYRARESARPSNHITCADGFKLSVIAGWGAYCSPRPGGWGPGAVAKDYPGPYTHVEVMPDEDVPEWEAYDAGGVYGNVPADKVRALIEAHGGETSPHES